MNVWLVTVGEPLPLPGAPGNPRLLRTGVLAQRLAEAGHSVIWWTSTFDHFGKRHSFDSDTNFQWAGGTVRALRGSGYSTNVSLRRFIDHADVARKFVRESAQAQRPDVILCSLPTIELAYASTRIGRERNIPVLLDIRDLWPDVLFGVLPARLEWLARLLLWPFVRCATRAMATADGLVGVSGGYLEWGLRYAARQRRETDAVIPLGYVAPSAVQKSAQVQERLVKRGVRTDKTLVWYVGSFGRQYDLGPVIEAARLLQAAGRNDVQFVISGDGDQAARWRELACNLSNVVLTGWIDADDINWFRAHASIGLQPYAAGAPQGLANKLFEYLSAGIPVVSSLAGENEELVSRHDCGLTYRAGSAADCLDKLVRLLDDPAGRRQKGANGKALFEREFDGRAVFDTLIQHLEGMVRQGTRKTI
jgi:glycosyltransferase involved in cell wall biosynthesis